MQQEIYPSIFKSLPQGTNLQKAYNLYLNLCTILQSQQKAQEVFYHYIQALDYYYELSQEQLKQNVLYFNFTNQNINYQPSNAKEKLKTKSSFQSGNVNQQQNFTNSIDQKNAKLFDQFEIMQRVKKQSLQQFNNKFSRQQCQDLSSKNRQKQYYKQKNKNLLFQKKIKLQNVQEENKQKKRLERMRKQVQNAFEIQYKFGVFKSIGKNEIEQIFSIVQTYLEKYHVLERHKILNVAHSLKGKSVFKNKIVKLQYLQLVDSAFYYTTKNLRLRSSQLLALLFYLFKFQMKKLLLQILTGQGKTSIIACLAAILTISGTSVDVVTANSILAERDVKQKRNFYQILGLKVDHNFKDKFDQQKPCYRFGTVVYGTPHSYQVDILYHEYKKRNTRGQRKFEAAIVDEVDSMFIDQKSHQTLLATVYPGFSQLIHPMRLIWNKINMYPILKGNQSYLMMIPDKNGTIVGKGQAVMNQIIKDLKKMFKNQIIPDWRMQFIELSMKDWIASAVAAISYYQKGYHYQIVNKNIVPIDFSNTGVLQYKVQWQNGLHQFLQFKHGLPPSTQGMTSNFISNLAHFDRYPILFGMTGTLGSESSKRFLFETYKAEMMKIPPFQKRLLQIKKGQMTYDQGEWGNKIAQSIQLMCISQRSVLLISKSIEDVCNIQYTISQLNQSIIKRIQVIKTGEEEIDDKVDVCQVIIATNLAGRGMDLKISQKLQKNGGLHVIITFMPNNQRVQMQDRGRAGRNGNQGSSEIICNYKQFCSSMGMSIQNPTNYKIQGCENIQNSTKIRNLVEQIDMKGDKKKVAELRAKDRVFRYYCQQVNKIPNFHKNRAKMLALQQRWAMFLKRVQYLKLSPQQIEVDAKKVVDELVLNSDSFYNPNHNNVKGIDEICKGDYQKASEQFLKSTKDESGTLSKIVGSFYGGCAKVNSNPKDNKTVQEGLNEINSTLNYIKQRKLVLKAQAGFLGILNDRQIIDYHQNVIDQKKKQYQNEFHEKINQQVIQREFKTLPLNKIEEAKQENKFQNNKFLNPEKAQKKQEILAQNKKSRIQQNKVIEQKSNLLQKLKIKQQTVSSFLNQSVEEKILNQIEKWIEKINQSYKGLEKDKYIQFQYLPIMNFIRQLPGNNKQNQQQAQKIINQKQLHFKPVLREKQVQKKETLWYERALGFILGVFQIVVGSLILAGTGGALAGFGANMIFEGVKDCCNAIFNPQVFADLKKYFSQKALSYTISLALSGMEGIQQLGRLSQGGFQFMKNATVGQICTKIGNGVVTGLGKLSSLGLKDWDNVLISQGLNQKQQNQHNNLPKIQSQNDARNFIHQKAQSLKNNKQLKNLIDKQYKNEKQIEEIGSFVTQLFRSECEEIIGQIIKKKIAQGEFIQLQNVEIPIEQYKQVIFHIMKGELKKMGGQQLSLRCQQFMLKYIDDPDISRKFIVEFQAQTIINQTIKKLKQNVLLDREIQKSILRSFKKIILDSILLKKQELENKAKNINNAIKYAQQHPNLNSQDRVNQIKQQLNNYKIEQTSFNEFCKYLQNRQIGDIINMLLQQKYIEKGKANMKKVQMSELPKMMKNILKKFESVGSIKNFQDCFQYVAYQCIIQFGVKALVDIKDSPNEKIEAIRNVHRKTRLAMNKN